MATTVQVNTITYATTHVATNLLLSLKLLIIGCGLDLTKLVGNWTTLEKGVDTWLDSGHLQKLVLEIYCPNTNVLIGRFDFDIDYGYYSNGDGALWIDKDTIRYALPKAGITSGGYLYDIIAKTAPYSPYVEGWSSTTFRSTSGFKRRSVGTAIGGGKIGSTLDYWRKEK